MGDFITTIIGRNPQREGTAIVAVVGANVHKYDGDEIVEETPRSYTEANDNFGNTV